MVDKEVLTDKQNEGGYFMFNTLNVRAPPPRETTWLDAHASVKNLFFYWFEKTEQICETPYKKAAKKLHNKIAGRVDQLNTRFPLFNPQPYY